MDFQAVKNIAVVGISAKEERASHQVAKYLQQKGYKIIPVNPAVQEVLGERCYPDLLSIPAEIGIDVVDIFRQSEAVPPIVDQALEKKAAVIWMQEGVVHEEAAEKARKSGMEVIMDKCLKKEHIKFEKGE